MSLVDEQIRSELENFSGQFGPHTIVPAKVLSYNEADETVSVELSSGAKVDDVRLKAMVKAGSKLVLVPKTGSMVLVGKIANSFEMVVLSIDEVEKLELRQGTVKLLVDDAGFEIAKGSDSLQKVLSDIIAEINKIVVLMGTSPNVPALTAIDTRLKQFLK